MKRLTLILSCIFLFTLTQPMLGQDELGEEQAETTVRSGKTKYADTYFKKFNFEGAAANYKSLVGKKNVDQAYVLSRAGDCYRLMNDPVGAEEWYAKATNVSGVTAETVYHYAQSLKMNSKYAAAKQEFERYQEMEPSDEQTASVIEGLEEVERLLQKNENYQIAITPFNSESSDFAPYIYENRVYFASNGYPRASGKEDVWTDKGFLQVYGVDEIGYDQYGSVEFLEGKKLNGNFHDGPVCVDPQTKDLYLTRNNYVSRKVSKDGIKNVNLKIMRKGQTEDGVWDGEIMDDFPFNSDDYSVAHASISGDGQTMYFASDMPHEDAMGGVDLYRVTRAGDSWDNLEHLGSEINTRGNERFPFIDNKGHLYFASDGLPGLGGMDIFEAIPDADNTDWSLVMNMGAELNTNYDDFALVMKDDVREGYFTSNRPSEFGDDDIYSFKDLGIQLIGTVVDADTKEPICGSAVEMSLGVAAKGDMITDCDGRFTFPVKPGNTYNFEGCADTYGCNEAITASTKGLLPGTVVEVLIPLTKPAPEADPFGLTVIVIDAKTKAPITASRVSFYDACNGSRFFRQSDDKGSSNYDAATDCEYFIGGMARGYFPKDTVVSTEGITEDTEVVIELTRDGVFDVAEGGEGNRIL